MSEEVARLQRILARKQEELDNAQQRIRELTTQTSFQEKTVEEQAEQLRELEQKLQQAHGRIGALTRAQNKAQEN